MCCRAFALTRRFRSSRKILTGRKEPPGHDGLRPQATPRRSSPHPRSFPLNARDYQVPGTLGSEPTWFAWSKTSHSAVLKTIRPGAFGSVPPGPPLVPRLITGPELTAKAACRSKALTAKSLLRSAAPFSLLHSLRFNRYAEPLPPLSWRGLSEL